METNEIVKILELLQKQIDNLNESVRLLSKDFSILKQDLEQIDIELHSLKSRLW